MKHYTEEELSVIVQDIEDYFQKNNYTSYDSCDIKALPFFLEWDQFFSKRKFGKYAQFPMNLLIDNFAGTIRLLTGIRKKAFAQSHALFLRAYLERFSDTKNKSYLDETSKLWHFIYEQRSKENKQLAWGQPYPWYAKKLIPAYTPRTTVTSQILHTLMDYYAIANEEHFLQLIKETSGFFLNEMNRSVNENDQVCFSYTLVDNYRVHNANMMASSALLRAGKLLKNKEVSDLGNNCLRYTIKRQNSDGSWYYYELPDNQKSKIDNYHTGYILEALAVIRELQGDGFKYNDEFNRGVDFYLNNFFQDGIIPKMTPDSLYPIDIQSCAQSILTFTALNSIHRDFLKKAKDVLDYTLDNLYSGKGYFHYRKMKSGRTVKISYIRWGDAWMYLALVKYLNVLRDV